MAKEFNTQKSFWQHFILIVNVMQENCMILITEFHKSMKT